MLVLKGHSFRVFVGVPYMTCHTDILFIDVRRSLTAISTSANLQEWNFHFLYASQLEPRTTGVEYTPPRPAGTPGPPGRPDVPRTEHGRPRYPRALHRPPCSVRCAPASRCPAALPPAGAEASRGRCPSCLNTRTGTCLRARARSRRVWISSTRLCRAGSRYRLSAFWTGRGNLLRARRCLR